VRPTALDEQFAHQLPELLPAVSAPSPHWRESLFFDVHDPSGSGDALFLTLAVKGGRMDSLRMGRLGGTPVLAVTDRPLGDDPHGLHVPGLTVEVVEPWREVRVVSDPSVTEVGCDLVFRARTQPYGLRRGTLRAADGLVWDQSHVLQSGTWSGTYVHGGVERVVDGWTGQRDRSWGVRDHGRCPLWMWFQLQLDDGFLGVWHWEYENGAVAYTDGCWAGTDGADPVPVVRFEHDVHWTAAGGKVAYDVSSVTGLEGTCRYRLADGRTLEVELSGEWARPYEPFHRGGLSVGRVRVSDGREGHGVFEVTGARHGHFFPGAEVAGVLPC
jgi:hypothetical protein